MPLRNKQTDNFCYSRVGVNPVLSITPKELLMVDNLSIPCTAWDRTNKALRCLFPHGA
jgi:hypothetical protein